MAKVHAIVAADSRARGFMRKPAKNKSLYYTHNVICPGGNSEIICSRLTELVSSIPTTDLIIVRVACGINELTVKEQHSGGTELSLRENENVLQNLRLLKGNLKLSHPRVHVGFATIPIISFMVAQKHYLSKGWLTKPKYNQKEVL
jgi:hypothetical protein